MILHIDMDAFFASIEQAINPKLKGKPLIVGSRASRMHTVVCAASYEAKALGIGSGMSTYEAYKICPSLEFVPADQSKYIWTSREIFKLLEAYGFELVYASIDEFQMDIGLNDPEKVAKSIQDKIYENFNITASVGVAKNWLLAKLGSKLKKPKGIVVINESNLKEILSSTPVDKLCGVGQATGERLRLLSIETCFDLYEKTAQFLEEFLGKYGVNLYLSLHLEDRFSSFESSEKPKTIGHSYTLPNSTENPVFLAAWIRLLSDKVAFRLRQENLVSFCQHIWLNGPDIGNISLQKSFQLETSDGYEISMRTLKIMASLGKKMPKIRAIGITCAKLKEDLKTLTLFKEQQRRTKLIEAQDSINNRFGEYSIYPAIIQPVK